LSISLRKLDCLGAPGESSVPVYAVRPEGLAALLDEMPAQASTYVRGTGFSAAASAIVLVPGRDGIGGAVLGLGEKGGPSPFGALAFGLPEGLAWRIAGPVDSIEDAALAFCLGAYRFDPPGADAANGERTDAGPNRGAGGNCLVRSRPD
jgi:leucyl aminopeptidase